MSLTQEQQVIKKLKVDGFVSRNWALKNYISRLSAIIYDLKKKDWKFETGNYKNKFGIDFRYYVLSAPKK